MHTELPGSFLLRQIVLIFELFYTHGSQVLGLIVLMVLIEILVLMGSGLSNLLKNKTKALENTSFWGLIDQFSYKNCPIKDGGY